MKRSELRAGEHYAVWHPAEQDKKNAVRVVVHSTSGAYDGPDGIQYTGKDGQGVHVVVYSSGHHEVIRLQLIRQTWADYEAGKEVPKWQYEPKQNRNSYKQALERVKNHPEYENASVLIRQALDAELVRVRNLV